MKKLLVILLSAALALSLFACTPAAPTQVPKESEPSAAPENSANAGVDVSTLRVAVMIPGSPTDGGFCQLGAEAAQAVKTQLGCDITVIEAPTADTMKSEAESLAEEGYNVIFGHGGQYASPFSEVSGSFPEVWFITLGGTDVTPNQFPLNITFEESVYVSGVLAGMMSKTGKIGMMVGGDYPAYTKTTRALELGAKSVNPQIETMFAVLSNIDMNEAYETTMNQIHSGADFIFANANEGSLGSIKAAVENEIYCIGALADYSMEAPDSCVISCICDYSMAYVAAVKACAAGIDKSEIMFTGMADGSVRLTWNEKLKSVIPAEVVAAVDDTTAKIISGEIDVPNEYE